VRLPYAHLVGMLDEMVGFGIEGGGLTAAQPFVTSGLSEFKSDSAADGPEMIQAGVAHDDIPHAERGCSSAWTAWANTTEVLVETKGSPVVSPHRRISTRFVP